MKEADKDVRHQRVIPGPDFEPAANPKPRHIETAMDADFLHEQSADEKAAENEKELHAAPADIDAEGGKRFEQSRALGRNDGVEPEDHHDGDAAKDIELENDGPWRGSGCFAAAEETGWVAVVVIGSLLRD